MNETDKKIFVILYFLKKKHGKTKPKCALLYLYPPQTCALEILRFCASYIEDGINLDSQKSYDVFDYL